MKREVENIVKWIRETVENAGAKGVIIGLSGGIDSAVVGALARRAFPNTSLGLIMPCESNEEDEKDARLVSEAIGLKIEKVDLTQTYRQLISSSFNSENRMARSNIKPRLRMTTLYYYAQDLGYLVLGCSNASEFYIGYYTKYGDSGSDIIPLAEYLKDEVYDLARELGVPNKIIDKQPTAGLWEAQTDEKEMGFSYAALNAYIRGEEVEEEIAKKIERMHNNSEHKRKFASIYHRK
ncbi:NAD+ synthase [Peptoniphilus asaccharolyticus DSM 20463]|uniref:NH(3)-dependent NAD(+) synthetase n=1 Tax=Peptoniphilus asaccharolyticus DSM 20463 TaxID=573058 RepID=A0A1W1VD29_PEPAS|nr:NAD(+) synthase [Peptoniphilus asaccharolyticus]MBL7575640.1 NAD(+) synthase [Peptoniphilus asaccharolyticus]SMB90854.1 NAD+ synthase [Peptoniphilus asaccharolyticus DSM 20463]